MTGVMGRQATVVLAVPAGLLAPDRSHAAGLPDPTVDAGIRRAVAPEGHAERPD